MISDEPHRSKTKFRNRSLPSFLNFVFMVLSYSLLFGSTAQHTKALRIAAAQVGGGSRKGGRWKNEVKKKSKADASSIVLLETCLKMGQLIVIVTLLPQSEI